MNTIEGSKILITGGGGFVGSHIADAVLAKGAAKVVALDNFVRGARSNVDDAKATGRFELVEGDIRDRALVDRLVAGSDYVFHQAALRITACAKDPREGHDVMMNGTFNVLEACATHKVKKLVAASSASVYGEADRQPIDEATAMFNNRTLYGGAKVALEQYLRAFQDTHGLKSVALRYFNLYGPRMDMTGVYTEVMVRWMDLIEAGQPPQIHGTGEQTMDFTFISDCVRANVLALESDVHDEAFNVATGVETSLVELCRAMIDRMGKTGLAPVHTEGRNLGPVGRRKGGTAKAKERLGFEAKVGLAEGLSQLIEWRRKVKAQEKP